MQLIIDGKKAVLKKGSSFDYVSENRAFSDADDYTLSITLPLAGCPGNLDIFGHLDRMDADSRHIVLEASLVDRGFSKNGVVTVVEASETEVKVQFLEGRSVQNFLDTFDNIYINELDLGSYPSSTLPDYVSHGDIDHGQTSVALPWVNDSSDGFMNNEVVVEDGTYKWADSTKGIGKLSYMPYLISITERICRAVGYTFDFSEWEASPEKNLLICNVLPASWNIPQFARALPHWTVAEYFEELEKILICEFNIDHRIKHIDVRFSKNIERQKSIVRIDKVVDSFTSEISYEDELCQYKGIANIRYADRGDSLWKIQQCQWLIDLMKTNGKHFKEFQTWNAYMSWAQEQWGPLAAPWFTTKTAERTLAESLLIHIVENDSYHMYRVTPPDPGAQYYNMCFYQWLTVNIFGDYINSPESDNDIELQCVPARVDSTDYDHGQCLFLDPSSFKEKEVVDSDGVLQPVAYSTFLNGEPDTDAEYYDKILLAYWDGHSCNQSSAAQEKILPPCPYVNERFSLKNRYKNYMGGLKVNPKEKMVISFLSTTVPDVRAVYQIRGKRYLCEKITATFTETGMSQLLKGVFYPIVEET